MKWLASLLAALWLTGCHGPELDQLDATLEALRLSPNPQSVESHEPFSVPSVPGYHFAERRSPFQASARVPEQALVQSGTQAPDPQRPLEPLEYYPLSALRLVGTLTMQGRRTALIETPGETVISAQVGAFIGEEYGRITHITEQDIRITERIATPQGWQEHQTSLALKTSP
ncbi:MAG: pilus assembly protein PilP [Halomonadaceae bacterium]|uniref:Pilus assembly protein PilP n=1 Tax=Halomonas colorata TaxID=2742615 RepID=A0ABR9FW12_9GAMM|nr:pilus assembly protein PilP [Halomonas colorata]MBE0462830.1 pilus assembly protein PilP [Halomonas colorata]